MNRNESYPAAQVTNLAVHLAWATLEMLVDDIEEMQVLVSGDDNDVNDLKIESKDGRLLVEQPTYGLTIKLNTERWMQLCVRIPRTWKGAVEANTIAGMLNARGLTGTDLTLDTVSGDLRAMNLSGIAVNLKTISGDIKAGGLDCEKLAVRTVSGSVSIQSSAGMSVKLSGVSGDQALELIRPFERVEATTVSGDVKLYVPMDKADVALRAVTGRVRTSGVSLLEGAPAVRVTSVSGNLEINRTEGQTVAEQAR